MSVNFRLTATKIIGQRKAFYRQRNPDPSWARKETVNIGILITSRNGGKKIMQSIRVTSRLPLRKGNWNQLRQFWRMSTKVIPTQKTTTGHISTMSQGFKRSSKRTSWVFPALKSKSHVSPQFTMSRISDSSSEANSGCCHRSDAWSHLE